MSTPTVIAYTEPRPVRWRQRMSVSVDGRIYHIGFLSDAEGAELDTLVDTDTGTNNDLPEELIDWVALGHWQEEVR